MSNELQSKVRERKQNSGDGEFKNVVIIPDFRVIGKVEGTKLEGTDARPGMFQLYNKKGSEFYPVEFKAIPLFYTAYNIVWSPTGAIVPGQPPFLVSIHDENRSVRWDSESKTYVEGPLVYGDADQDIPASEVFEKYGKPGTLVYFLLENERVVKMHLLYADEEAFDNAISGLKPFTPVTIKSHKKKAKNGQTVYRLEFSSAAEFPSNIKPQFHLDRVKQEVFEMLALQEGKVTESEE